MADDEVIRKRLLIDGEGVGDDRRITTLLKTFLKWCNNDEEKDPSYQKMFAQLAQCEIAMGKTQAVYEMNERETTNYENVFKEIGVQHPSITFEYLFLLFPEYDALAQGIAKHPERQETMRQIEELEKVLTQQTETKESLASKLELRKKQFYLLIKTIHELQNMIDEDKTDQESQFSSEVGAEPSSSKVTSVNNTSSEKSTLAMDTT
ncbi:THO complex subunit 7 homolog [Actinia tenebrosa]|uniref:THO complex subunit 7 homolog n=1 Tax=Actinia tenebrosa TaxID=6105 RepID=A0A6P8IX36_ACTTE|nr:THO complex subunit 7 homolog [Actinia tenebrosa]